MEYYSATKKRRGNPAISNNMNDKHEGIMLSKISQTEKDKYCMISLNCGVLKNAEFIESGSRIVVTKGWRVGETGRY